MLVPVMNIGGMLMSMLLLFMEMNMTVFTLEFRVMLMFVMFVIMTVFMFMDHFFMPMLMTMVLRHHKISSQNHDD